MNIRNVTSIFFISIWCLIFIGIGTLGWGKTWNMLLVPSMYPPLADLRTVQASLQPLNPNIENQVNAKGDPWKREMNYPSIWIKLGQAFAIHNEINYQIFGGTIVLSFIISCLLFLRKYPSICLLIILFGNSFLLGVERGNNDLLIFSILYFSIISPILIRFILTLTAIALKIYPVFVLISFYRNIKILISLVFISTLYFIFNIDDLVHIKLSTPNSATLSYGSSSISSLIGFLNSYYIDIIMIVFSIIFTIKYKIKKSIGLNDKTDNEEIFFLTGSGIYIGTFLLSSNWDYRLIFLIFCIPYIIKYIPSLIKYNAIILIILSSNQMVLKKLLGSSGIVICITSKILLFFLLSNITINIIWPKIVIYYNSNRGKFSTSFPRK